LAGDASRTARIFAFDIASERLVAEFVYRLDVAASEFQPDKDLPKRLAIHLSTLPDMPRNIEGIDSRPLDHRDRQR